MPQPLVDEPQLVVVGVLPHALADVVAVGVALVELQEVGGGVPPHALVAVGVLPHELPQLDPKPVSITENSFRNTIVNLTTKYKPAT